MTAPDNRARDRVALELMSQEFAPRPKSLDAAAEIWAELPDFDQNRYLERADRLVAAYEGTLR